MKKPKYKVGNMVYTYLNPTVKRRISHVRVDELGYTPPNYKLALYDKEGYSYSSKWVGEGSISKIKLR